jgi:uncharacterized protein YebE (UPF0316 family)
MNTLLWLIITFSCGTAYELGCVFWTHYSEANKIVPASLWSIFNALITCIGLGSALKNPLMVIAYALGFGAGTALGLGIKIKQGWKKESKCR